MNASIVDERTPKKSRRLAVWVLLSVFVVALVAVGAYTVHGAMLYRQVERIEPLQAFPAEEDRPGAVPRSADANQDPINFLLMGADGDEDSVEGEADLMGLRSDMMILVNIPADRSSVNLMSIMRDNWVPVPGYGTTKINAALAHGGPALAVNTVEDILDVPIDHVAIIDFTGLVEATDAIGGVTVPNASPFSCGSETVPVGEVTLDGDRALCYLRNRNYPDGDYTRVENQQTFLLALAQQMATRDVLTNPLATRQALTPILDHLTMDDGLNISTLTAMALSLRDFTAINTYTSPTLGIGFEGQQSVVYPDWEELEIVSQHLRDDTFTDYLAGTY